MIIAVDLSAELHFWNAIDQTFVRFGGKALDVFTDSRREFIETIVRLMGLTQQTALCNMRTLAKETLLKLSYTSNELEA